MSDFSIARWELNYIVQGGLKWEKLFAFKLLVLNMLTLFATPVLGAVNLNLSYDSGSDQYEGSASSARNDIYDLHSFNRL